MNDDLYKALRDAGFRAGFTTACAYSGETGSEMLQKQAYVNELDNDAAFQKFVVKTASYIFQQAGPEYEFMAAFYDTMGKKDENFTPYVKRAFVDPVLYSFAWYGQAMKEAKLEKSASFLAKKLVGLFGSIPDVFKTTLLAGGVGGAGIGSLAWLLNRHANEQDVETEAKELQAKHYRAIAADIRKRLAASNANSPDSRALKKAIEEAGEASYIL